MFEYEIDNLTVGLLAILAALAIYHRFFSTPTPQVHPLLLGKQSEVSQVRKDGESGVYRNWATGHGAPFTVRPANSLKTVNDVVSNAVSQASAVPKCILDVSLSDEALSELIRLLPIGLAALFSLPTSTTSPKPILTLLPPSPSCALPLLLLQLASPPSSPLVVLPSPKLITTALTRQDGAHPLPGLIVVHEVILEDLLEQVCEDCKDVGILVVGDTDRSSGHLVRKARERGMVIHWWEEVWNVAEASTNKITIPTSHFNDVHSYFYSSSGDDSTAQVVKVTHLNITAGIAGILSSFPPDKRPSATSRDVVGSSVRLDTPLGMCVALASIWSGAGFRFIGPPLPTWAPELITREEESELERLMQSDQPAPTLLFLSNRLLCDLNDRLRSAFAMQPLARLAAPHKLRAVRGGQVSRTGPFEKAAWRPIRAKVLSGVAGEKLRGIIVVGETPSHETMAAASVLLSIPIAKIYASNLSTGPIFASHFYDVQSQGIHHSALTRSSSESHSTSSSTLAEKSGGAKAEQEKSHTGPPASNVEIVLKGPESYVPDGQETGRICGRVWIRGPGVLELIGGESLEGWADTGVTAEARTNGTFIVS